MAKCSSWGLSMSSSVKNVGSSRIFLYSWNKDYHDTSRGFFQPCPISLQGSQKIFGVSVLHTEIASKGDLQGQWVDIETKLFVEFRQFAANSDSTHLLAVMQTTLFPCCGISTLCSKEIQDDNFTLNGIPFIPGDDTQMLIFYTL